MRYTHDGFHCPAAPRRTICVGEVAAVRVGSAAIVDLLAAGPERGAKS